jgi:tRNA-(ms[2]io[6]A)-hydroxylase
MADLPLRYHTPALWAEAVLSRPLELLNDHAHLEKKAVSAMTAVARDEVSHLATVSKLLARRGGRLTRSHGNPYAAALHALVRRGRGSEELVDRLMISALIEARSCERFKLLGDAVRDDAVLQRLYKGLWASEHGHYRTFIGLAEQVLPEASVARRWDQMLDAEARIIRDQSPGPRMHSGVG